MIAFIKRNPLAMLFALMALALVIELIVHVYYGYYSSGNILIILSMGILAVVRYILVLICVAVTTWSIIKHHHNLFFTFSWIFIATIGQIPKGHFDTLGALLALYNTNPNQVHNDAAGLMDKYPPMTCIGYRPQRYPCDNPVIREKLPSSIQRIHSGDVLILEDYILIEKFGLQGTFRGFVVFRNGADVWINEKPISLEGECNTCWKIRIMDGFYWYHADPSDPPIFTSPLN
jgi:hypothetical protein